MSCRDTVRQITSRTRRGPLTSIAITAMNNPDIEACLEKIRDAINSVPATISEHELTEALVAESEGWRMRLQELEDDGE
ncbi:MAG: hypothetical protein ACO1TE_29200 [Prosthecobacter sp.]